MDDKYEILDNNRDPDSIPMKPIDEVKIMVNGMTKDISSIRSDLAIIKNRLHELQRDKRRLQEEKMEGNKWGWGFY